MTNLLVTAAGQVGRADGHAGRQHRRAGERSACGHAGRAGDSVSRGEASASRLALGPPGLPGQRQGASRCGIFVYRSCAAGWRDASRPRPPAICGSSTRSRPGTRRRYRARFASGSTSTLPRPTAPRRFTGRCAQDDLRSPGSLLRAGADVKAANRYGVTALVSGVRQRQRAR